MTCHLPTNLQPMWQAAQVPRAYAALVTVRSDVAAAGLRELGRGTSGAEPTDVRGVHVLLDVSILSTFAGTGA